MPKTEAEIEEEADNLEKEAKIEIAKKNYIQAIGLLKKAKDLNSQLGFIGQVGMIDKKISRLENLVDYKQLTEIAPKVDVKQLEKEGNRLLDKAQELCDSKNNEKAIELYNEALEIYDKLNFEYQYQQIKKKIESLKSTQQLPSEEIQIQETDSGEEILDLSVASKRKEIIQRELEKKKVEKSIKLERNKLTYEQELIESQKQKAAMLRRIRERSKIKPIEKKTQARIRQEPDNELKEKMERLNKLREEEQREKELIQKADELLEKGNKFLNQNRYEVARLAYKEAIEIYKILGWKNQVDIITQELNNIDDYENEYNEEIRKKTLMGKSDDIPTNMEKFRRKKIREDMEQRIKLEEERKLSDELIQSRESIVSSRSKRAKADKILSYEEKKKLEAELRKQADKTMTQAKRAVDNKRFDQAKEYYKQAIKTLKQLKWFDQVAVLYEEIKNIDQYKVEYMKKQKTEEEMRLKREQEWQQRVNSMVEMEKRIKAGRASQLNAIPPDIEKKLEKIKLLKEKAKKEEAQNKFNRAINRYDYILNLYNSIPTEIVDLNNEKKEIEKRITILKNK